MNEIIEKKEIIFNHYYKLRHDLKRSFIFGSVYVEGLNYDFVNTDWISRIHPIYAMIFSFFSQPIKFTIAIKEIAYFLDISEEECEGLLIRFINNKEPIHIEHNNIASSFPKNILIDASKSFTDVIQYNTEQFVYDELDFKRERLYIAPVGIVFMVNNTCMTDCIYCYADKRQKIKTLPFNLLSKIIKQSFELGLRDFAITGGEFFLYKDWRNLLKELMKYKYKPDLISTKIPITEKDIIDIKPFNIRIQISLDSCNSNELKLMLQTKNNYLNRILDTIFLLDKYDVKFQIATVLTKYNDSIDNLNNILTVIGNLKNLVRWEIRVAFKSLYSKKDFDDIKISKYSIDNIEKWIKNIQEKTILNILWSPNEIVNEYFKSKEGSKQFRGKRCSANFTHMVILPDGNVTICEQLYWDKRFIIGNILEQSIEEIWNSPRALQLAFPQREDFRDTSACNICPIFERCFAYPNKCFAEILKVYGTENWDFPDPRCEKAPPLIY